MNFPFFPPHPKIKTIPENLGKLESCCVAQRKFNGTHLVIEINNSQIQIWNRHGEHLSFYQLTDSMKQCLLSLNLKKDKKYIFGGELLHNKAKSKITNIQAQSNTIVLFDVYCAGNYLFGMKQIDRLLLLEEICHNAKKLEEKKRGILVKKVQESELWLAECFYDDFEYRFYEFYEFDKHGNDKFPEIEGLVLRMKESILPKLTNKMLDVNWMIRCRKKKENVYDF